VRRFPGRGVCGRSTANSARPTQKTGNRGTARTLSRPAERPASEAPDPGGESEHGLSCWNRADFGIVGGLAQGPPRVNVAPRPYATLKGRPTHDSRLAACHWRPRSARLRSSSYGGQAARWLPLDMSFVEILTN
jgi:hypothetical protein